MAGVADLGIMLGRRGHNGGGKAFAICQGECAGLGEHAKKLT